MLSKQIRDLLASKDHQILQNRTTKGEMQSLHESRAKPNSKKLLDSKRVSRGSQLSQSISTTTLKPKRVILVNRKGQKVDQFTVDERSALYNSHTTMYSQQFRVDEPKTQRSLSTHKPLEPLSSFNQEQAGLKQTVSTKVNTLLDENTAIASLTKGISAQPDMLLDIISPDDPIWNEIIPTELKEDKNFSLKQFIEDNQEYVYHLLGLLYHERSARDIPLQKISLHNRIQSSYQQDFTASLPQLQNDILPRHLKDLPPLTQSGLQSQSAYQEQFTVKSPSKTINMKPTDMRNLQRMSLLTSYNQDFFNWKPQNVEKVKGINSFSTGRFPFLGESIYKRYFKVNALETPQKVHQKKIGPFPSIGNMIYTTSTSKDAYKPQKQETFSKVKVEDVPNLDKQGSRSQATERHLMGSISQCFLNYNASSNSNDNFLQQEKCWRQKVVEKLQIQKHSPILQSMQRYQSP